MIGPLAAGVAVAFAAVVVVVVAPTMSMETGAEPGCVTIAASTVAWNSGSP